MGNCLKGSRSSTMVWAETDDENDQWVYYSDPNLQQKQSLLNENIENQSKTSVSDSENGKNREVKITLSKKELEELLSKVGGHRNIPVDQILDRLIDSRNRLEFDDQYLQKVQWKPNLQSIPEEK